MPARKKAETEQESAPAEVATTENVVVADEPGDEKQLTMTTPWGSKVTVSSLHEDAYKDLGYQASK